jgi:bacteriocin biosynthesis cyclodehydratase domain-containing protein
MLKRPRFKPHLRVQVVQGEGAFVLSDDKQILLRGALYEAVSPWVDGRDPDDICARAAGKASAAQVYYVLGQLERKGYLCEDDTSLSPGEAALWSEQNIDPATAAQRLSETPVELRAFGVPAAPLAELLRSVRVRVEERANLGVVLADSHLNENLRSYNGEAQATGRPWLLVRPLGRQILVGPFFRPGVTGCWECLEQRLRANSPVETYLTGRNGQTGSTGSRAATPATWSVAHGLAAQAISTWIIRGDLAALEGKIQSFDLATWQMHTHILIRLPHCRACGSTETRPETDAPITLQRRPKTFTGDGGHRVVSPEVTLARYGHHVSPLTGAVTMLERVGSNGDGAMHVYIAGQNVARRHRTLDHLRGDLRNMSSGKGASDVQARASGLCEGLERHSGVFHGDETRRRARLIDLGGAGIHPHACLLYSEQQYLQREEWNRGGGHYNFVPVPFDPSLEIEWTPVWSLTHQRKKYLPTAYCYFNYPHGESEPFCLACSNGNAAGNTLEEAILQGFFELVERDSVALWWYNRVNRPGVDVDSFSDPYLAKVKQFLARHGRQMWVLDLTSDLNIPVFAALCRNVQGGEEQIILGFGAHLDAHIALLRAVTEMNQMLSSLLEENGLSEDITDRETVHWLRTATVENQPYLLPDRSPPKTASMYPWLWTDDVSEDVRFCQSLVESQGMEMLVLDQTRPEIGLPVAKVIVPGLRHFWARFAPGRLYDVPVRLGWLPAKLREEELNPIPMFL